MSKRQVFFLITLQHKMPPVLLTSLLSHTRYKNFREFIKSLLPSFNLTEVNERKTYEEHGKVTKFLFLFLNTGKAWNAKHSMKPLQSSLPGAPRMPGAEKTPCSIFSPSPAVFLPGTQSSTGTRTPDGLFSVLPLAIFLRSPWRQGHLHTLLICILLQTQRNNFIVTAKKHVNDTTYALIQIKNHEIRRNKLWKHFNQINEPG